MLALVCSCLLLAAGASDAWTGKDSAEPNSDLAESIRDMHAKITEIWQELAQRRDGDGALHAACQVQPSATLDAAQPRVTGVVLFRQLAPRAKLEAFFALGLWERQAREHSERKKRRRESECKAV
ncbi:hypothetical protein EGM_20602 [Macaca fascicularis]|uniref:Uncharacterized protein n=1 Tax=Macaca fascicularis TaxID=9541 RepID=G8F4T9_MACFA|nr:hypothetical protein EGM_20602 [Macaca fascicularis]